MLILPFSALFCPFLSALTWSIDLPSQAYINIFEKGCNGSKIQPLVEGFSVLKGELPHFDVFVVGESPLGKALQVSFGEALEAEDVNALLEMSRQRASQAIMAEATLTGIVGREDMARQRELMLMVNTNNTDKPLLSCE